MEIQVEFNGVVRRRPLYIDIDLVAIAETIKSCDSGVYVDESGTELVAIIENDTFVCFPIKGVNRTSENELREIITQHMMKFVGLEDYRITK